ncbi:MAG: efflux RND transporter periplasmic adaptor subunit [Planctomycetota bacterium]
MTKQSLLSGRRALDSAALTMLLLASPACGGRSEFNPAADPHSDAGQPAREGEPEVLRWTEAQIEAAGIRLVPAAAGEILRQLALPAVAAANADAVTHVNPKAPGIVRSIYKHLGEEVAAGELLCVIDSVELGNAAAGYLRARALAAAAETTLARESELFQGRLEAAERVLQGAVEINQRIRDRERELHEKAVSTIRPLLEAEKALQGAELERDRALTELRAERDARLLALEVERRERRIGEDAARNQMLALGLSAGELPALDAASPLLAGTYEIRAPRSGIVSGRHISTGEFVDAATTLYTLEDLSRVWILASVFEAQLRSVRTGQWGQIRLDAFPGEAFAGEVTLVGYEVDAESRAVGVRLELDNPALPGWPEAYPIRPGMFGRVDLVVERSEARVALPESAIVHEAAGDFVFVRVAPGTFERRPVRLGSPAGELVEVVDGLQPGEEIAVAGTFQLKSALRKGELGEGHSD